MIQYTNFCDSAILGLYLMTSDTYQQELTENDYIESATGNTSRICMSLFWMCLYNRLSKLFKIIMGCLLIVCFWATHFSNVTMQPCIGDKDLSPITIITILTHTCIILGLLCIVLFLAVHQSLPSISSDDDHQYHPKRKSNYYLSPQWCLMHAMHGVMDQ